MRHFGLVFLLVFYQFGSFVADETCWDSIPKIISIVNKYETQFSEFLNSSLAEIEEVSADTSLNDTQKFNTIIKILIKRRVEILEIKWTGIKELSAVFEVKVTEGEILFNGLKKFLGLTRSPTFFPFRCYVKDAKHLATKAYETYQSVAQLGIHINKHLSH